jgi:hypothetical protein
LNILCIPLFWTSSPSSMSLSRMEQFSFEYIPLSHETSSRIHYLLCFGQLTCQPIPVLRPCTPSDLYFVLVWHLWEVCLSPYPCS